MPGHSAQHVIQMKLARLFKGELREIYWSVVMRNFAIALVGIFIPVYMLSEGYTLGDAISFQIIIYASLAFFSIPAAILSGKYGIKRTAQIGSLTSAVFLAALTYFDNVGNVLFLLAILGGAGVGFFWIPLNAWFAKNRHKGKVGKEVSYLELMPKLAGMFAPLIGGVMIVYLGFNILFGLATALLVFSTLPLFKSAEHRSRLNVQWSKLFSWKYKTYMGEFVSQGVVWIIPAVMFPIYIFYLSSSYTVMGALSTLGGIITAFTTLQVGYLFDKIRGVKLMRYAGLTGVFIWTSLIWAVNPITVYLLSFAIGVSFVFLNIPLFAIFCNRLKTARVEFMALRDVFLGLGRTVPLLILLVIPDVAKFQVAFAMAAMASLWFVFADL